MELGRRLSWSAVFSIFTSISDHCCGRVARGAPFAQFPQKFIRRYEERVLLEDAADDDHRVGPHDVDDDLPAKLGEIVQSYDRVLIARQHTIQPRLVLLYVVDSRSIFKGTFHMGDQPGHGGPLLDAAVKDLLDEGEHPVLIEVTIAQIGVSPVA